jgi:hypothetical protein
MDSCRRRWFLLPLLLLLTACARLGASPGEVQPEPTLTLEPPQAEAFASEAALGAAVVPPRDLVSLTRRFRSDEMLATVARTEPQPYAVGDTATFWTKNHDTNVNESTEAVLLYRSDELNMWFETSGRVRHGRVAAAAGLIETEILPRSRSLLGEEWRPGVDADPRVNILHTTNLGAGVIGYYSSADEFVTAVNPYSNQREMLYINLDNAPLGSDGYYEVVAHELAHMIHWRHDPNEAAWVEEGLAELSAHLSGYNQVDFETSYIRNPDVQLTNFTEANGQLSAQYGAAFLFLTYFRDRFGDVGLRALVDRPENGVAGFEAVLAENGGGAFASLFGDWAVANYLASQEPGLVSDTYAALNLPAIGLTAEAKSPGDQATGTVHQFGVDYLSLQPSTPATLVFTGTQQIGLLPLAPHSGGFVWSTYPADNADMTLTGRFDLTSLDSATLTFWSWYDIEAGWDYAYVVVSIDDGATWTPLETIYTTLADPQGNSYGPGLTGVSGRGPEPEWVEQKADLSPFVGGELLVRFEYVTDQSQHGAGLVLDDIAIPELRFFDDVEGGAGNWEAAGFVRHANRLPQTWLLQLITLDDTGFSVEMLALDGDRRGRWPLAAGEEAVLAISGTAPVTTLPAAYQWQLIPAD